MKWWELSTCKERVQRGKVWFRRIAAHCAVGLIMSAHMLLRSLKLRTVPGSPASRRRQEFNASSQCREGSVSLHKITTSLWEPALGKPKPKGDVLPSVVASNPLSSAQNTSAARSVAGKEPYTLHGLHLAQTEPGRLAGYRSFSCSSSP